MGFLGGMLYAIMRVIYHLPIECDEHYRYQYSAHFFHHQMSRICGQGSLRPEKGVYLIVSCYYRIHLFFLWTQCECFISFGWHFADLTLRQVGQNLDRKH